MNDQSNRGEQSLADLIGSRICHDLVNPLGAVGNGVELLEMTGGGTGPEMELIRDAVRDAQARIRFFRIAFGAAGPQQMVSLREARDVSVELYRQTRMTLDWTVQTDLPRTRVKLAYLMMLCAESALPMGGTVTIGMDGAGHFRMSADAPRVNLDEALWSTLRFGPAAAGRPLRAAEAQFAALHACAEELDITVNYVAEETTLMLATA